MLTVICKATFDLEPEESPLAADQDEPTPHDEYWNDDANASLRAASDILPFKRSADVVVVGYAYAPSVLSEWPYQVRLIVGDSIDKRMEVHGDRQWNKEDQLVINPCPPRISLRWERAAGGPGTMNPVGVFPPAIVEPGQPRKLPNFEPPMTRVVVPSDVIPPIGFGPIAPSWRDRKSLIDTSEGDWDPRAWHEKPLAPYVDAAFFQTAPADQRLEMMRGDERIQLENLHPNHPRFSTRLAPVHPHVVVHKSGKTTADLDMRCDTLVIDTERCVATLTWRGSIPLAYADDWARVEIATERNRRPSNHSNVSASTVVLGSDEQRTRASSPALPFAIQDLFDRPKFDPTTISLEKFAALTAEMHEGQTTRFRILDANSLTNDDWQAVERHWKRAIDEDSASGQHTLRRKYDDAYLAMVEKYRGPITADERKKIMESLERGQAEATLDELKIQRPALMPILRSVTRIAASEARNGAA